MSQPLHLVESRVVPVDIERAWDIVLPAPLTTVFARRFWAISPITEVRDQVGSWGQVGQLRTIRLADGGTMREELTEVERPDHFSYRITEVTGALKPLVHLVEGSWSFRPKGAGTEVTWSWTMHPRSAVAGRAGPVFSWLWHGYARRALEQVESLVTA